MPSVSPFAPLERIGDDVFLYEPSGGADPNYSGPSLIVMSTWLGGASAKNIRRYIEGHRELFRDAAVLLVTARLSEITVTPFVRMHARLQPARDVIIRYVVGHGDGTCSSSPSSPSILWHIFSNGGLNMAIQLARITRDELAAKHTTTNSLNHPSATLDTAMGGVILDCCPGDDSLSRTYRAATYSLPNTWASQTIGRLVLFPTIAVLLGVQNSGVLGSRDGSLGGLYRGANEPDVFGPGARRLYLYSVSDKLVPWRVVNKHMQEARAKGLVVDGEAIPGGVHCALIRADAGRYWRAVERFWFENRDRDDMSGGDASVREDKCRVDMEERPAAIALLRSRL